jgi:hypothetical protein
MCDVLLPPGVNPTAVIYISISISIKISVIPSGIESNTFRLVVRCLNQLPSIVLHKITLQELEFLSEMVEGG